MLTSTENNQIRFTKSEKAAFGEMGLDLRNVKTLEQLKQVELDFIDNLAATNEELLIRVAKEIEAQEA